MFMPMGPLVHRAVTFRPTLLKAREKSGVDWYPYDSLANMTHIEELLGNDALNRLKSLAGDSPILDIGCGDGDLSFFLEHLGHEVHAIDNPATNHNGMKGIAALKERLKSKVEIDRVDIDGDLRLPTNRYRLAIFLGILYHLKNPYYVLERMARSCQFMLLSTRIASTMHPLAGSVEDAPIAYLVGDDELNNDNSNYWILTKACLLRILARTQWKVEELRIVKFARQFDDTSFVNDERAFVLLRSAYGAASQVEMMEGWHAPENEGWRWTERRFTLRIPSSTQRQQFTMKLFLPDAVAKLARKVVLKASLDGASLGDEQFRQSGEHSYVRALPPKPADAPHVIHFELSHALAPETNDQRERGVIVSACQVDVV